MKRKQFIQTGVASAAALVLPKLTHAQIQQPYDNFNLEQIEEFVFAAHKDIDKVKSIINKSPLLLNCANQAKKGDFETALGGASHMGRNDIADLLVERGARMDIFNMCFLGFIDMTKELLAKYPHLLKSPGPHGFTLLHHAKVGKHEKFADWLLKQGLETNRFENYI